MLENNGDMVTLIDFSVEPFKEQKLLNEIQQADVIGITVLSFALENVVKLIKLIKKIKPQLPVMIGGPHCTLFPQKSLQETDADISVQGDGEFTILQIEKALKKEISFSEIPGIYYRENNIIKKGADLQFYDNLDVIPFPARHLVNKYTYGSQFTPKIKNANYTSIITSRGCPYSCKFCSRNSISMKKYRTRSVENILNELKEIQNNGYEYVAIVDDSFLSNKQKAHELFDKIIENQLHLKFMITAVRVDAAEEGLFKKMKKAGVTHIQYGLESGNQDILDFYNKNITLDEIIYAVNASSNAGLFTLGSFIFGAPFETKEHFERTIQFAKKLPLDSIGFALLKYMAGSELWCNAVKDKKISENDYFIVADSKKGLGLIKEQEIVHYCLKARREYYVRPSFIIRLLIKSLKNNDFGFIQSYFQLFFNDIKDGLKYLGILNKENK